MGSWGFWLFLAVVVGLPIWRKTMLQRDALSTIRAAIEKGQQIDPAALAAIIGDDASGRGRHRLGGGLVIIATGVGLAIMGVLIGRDDAEALRPLLGVGLMLGLIGCAALAADWLQGRQSQGRK